MKNRWLAYGFTWVLFPGLLVAGERFGGIEIGARGVKAVVLDSDSATGTDAIAPIFKGDRNTSLGKLENGAFAGDAMDDTVTAVGDLFEMLTGSDWSVPKDRISIVASSGLPRTASNWKEFAERIQAETNIELKAIDVNEEVRLSILGLVGQAQLKETLLIDIGSGNTKGGYLDGRHPSRVQQFSIAGSRKGAEDLKQLWEGKDDKLAVARQFSEELTTKITDQWSQLPATNNKRRILLLGGTSWAFTTYALPEQIAEEFVRIPPGAIASYVASVQASLGMHPEAQLNGLDAKAQEDVAKQVQNVRNVFDADSLLAGAEILVALNHALHLDQPDTQVYFVRNSQYAWITGYVAEKAGLRQMPPADELPRFGGIEIGAKGVKAIVLEGSPASPPEQLRPVFSSDRNTTLGKTDGENRFVADALADTVEAVRLLHQELTQKQSVPEKSVWVVASSGLPMAKNWSELVDAIQSEVGIALQQITVDEEVRLSIIGLSEAGVTNNSLLIDIGSGNTKGGILDANVPAGVLQFSGPGSKKLAEELKALAADRDRFTAADEFRTKQLSPAFQEQLQKLPQITQKSTVLVLGGATWAFTTLALPEQIQNETVRFSPADIENYRTLLMDSPGKFPNVDLASVPADAKERASQEMERVKGVFDPDALLAGMEILQALSDSMAFSNKQVYFLRNSQYAWITGYVAEATGLRKKPQLPIAPSETSTKVNTSEMTPKTELSSAPKKVAIPNPVHPSEPLAPLVGLSEPLETLTQKLDYPQPTIASPRFYAEIADRCYRRGWYGDSAVLWREAAAHDPQARYCYLQALSELQKGDSEAAMVALQQFQQAVAERKTEGYDIIRERFNGPVAVKLHELLRQSADTNGPR